jgi:hypothetical protein
MRQLGSFTRDWDCGIKRTRKGILYSGLDLSHLAQNTELGLRLFGHSDEHSGSIKRD